MQLLASEHDFITTLRKALTEIDDKWESYNGLIIPGSHKPNMVEEKIEVIRSAREDKIPALLICFGHQLGAIEYARNVIGIKDATSEEFSEVGTFVVKKRNELNVGLKNGESYWNNYEVVLANWQKPEWFVATQYHSEYQSSKDKPHPLLVHFINLCKKYG